jgi:sugar phosphate permease
MVTVGAILGSVLIGWLVDMPLEAMGAPFGVSALISLVISTVAFYFVRAWLKRMRGG